MASSRSLRIVARGLGLVCSAGLLGCGSASGPDGPPPPPPVPAEPHRIAVIRLGGEPAFAEIPTRSIAQGLELFLFQEGTHFTLALDDLGDDPDALPAAIDRAAGSGADVIVLTHALLLPPAVDRASGSGPPIVFGILGDPVALGAGESDDRHPAGLTGAYHPLPTRGLLDLIRFYLPDARRVGTVHDPGDPISAAHLEALVRASDESELELIIAEDVDALLAEPIDAAVLVAGSPPELLGRASEAEVPVFGITEAQALAGAIAAEVPQPDRVGLQVGRLVHALLDGKAPESIPFSRILDCESLVNLAVLESLGVPLPNGALRFSRPVGGGTAVSSD